MRRAAGLLLALGLLGVAVWMVVRGAGRAATGSTAGRPAPEDERAAALAVREAPPPAPTPPPAPMHPRTRELFEPPPALARARFVAIDALSRERIDPHGAFTIRLSGHLLITSDTPLEDGGVEIAFEPPSDDRHVEADVRVDGWGHRAYRGRHRVASRAAGPTEEIVVELQPIAPDEWREVDVVLEGEGSLVGDFDAARVRVTAPAESPAFHAPSLPVEFAPGEPRRRRVRAPSDDVSGRTEPLVVRDRGSVLWIDAPRGDPTRESADGVVRLVLPPAGTSAADISVVYPPDGPRPPFELWGTWLEFEGLPRRVNTTFHADIAAGPDRLRIVRGPGRLGLGAKTPGRIDGVRVEGSPFDFAAKTRMTGTLDLTRK